MRKILVLIAAVIACYFFPDSPHEYTELLQLRENSYCSAALIVIIAMFSRGWFAIAIMAIEISLIAMNFHIAFFWGIRDSLFFANYYTQLQDAAFAIELAIIAARIITGLREIGADIDSFNHWLSARSSAGNHRERHK